MVDVYAYLTNLLRFFDRLQQQGFSEFWTSLGILSQGGRPPFYQLLTLPFVFLLGRSEDAALSVNLIFIAILLISVYNLGRLAKNKRVGILAALVVISYPPIVRLSRVYSPYFAMVACCALSIWLLLIMIKRRSVKSAWLFGFSLAFGLLTHPRFVWIILVPTIIFGILLLLFHAEPKRPQGFAQTPKWFLNKLRDRFVIRGLLPSALLTLGLVLPWYLTHGRRLFGMAVRFPSSDLAQFRGFEAARQGFPEIQASFWWFALTAPGAISNALALFALLGLVFAILQRSFSTSVLLITVIAGYSLFSLQKSFAWFYFVTLLPFLAILTAAWITGLRPKWLSKWLTVACVALSIFNFSVVSWGAQPWSRTLASALGAPVDTSTCMNPVALAFCPSPPKTANWPVDSVLQIILDDPDCQSGQPCQLMVVKGNGLTDFLFKYHLARDLPRFKLPIKSQLNRVFGAQYPLSTLLESDYIFYRDNDKIRKSNRKNYLNATNRFLKLPPKSFANSHETVAQFEVPGGLTAKLSRRVAPLTVTEAEDTIAALDLDEKYKSRSSRLLSRLYRSENADEGTGAYYLEALSQTTDTESRVKLLLEAGVFYTNSGGNRESVASLEEAVRLAPNNINARILLANAYRAGKEITKAIAALEYAISLVPDNVEARLSLSNMLLALPNQLEKVIFLLEEASSINPNNLRVRILLGRALRRAGKLDEAVAEFKAAIALAPDLSKPRVLLANTYLSFPGQTDQAVAQYQEAIKMNTSDYEARIGLALAYRKLGEPQRAIIELEKAVAIAPGQPRARRVLAKIYRSLGQKTKAISVYEEILKIKPQDVVAKAALDRLRSSK